MSYRGNQKINVQISRFSDWTKIHVSELNVDNYIRFSWEECVNMNCFHKKNYFQTKNLREFYLRKTTPLSFYTIIILEILNKNHLDLPTNKMYCLWTKWINFEKGKWFFFFCNLLLFHLKIHNMHKPLWYMNIYR